MIKNKIISFLRAYKVAILFWIAVIIGTVVLGSVLDNVYQSHFADIESFKMEIKR